MHTRRPSPVLWSLIFGLLVATCLTPHRAACQQFIHTSGTHSWNDANNWTPATAPNSVGAAATIPGDSAGPTGDLTVTLNSAVTIGSLTLHKPTGGNTGVTTIAGPATLTFDNGASNATLTNSLAAVTAAAGQSIVAVPLVLNSTLAVQQSNADPLRFDQSLSGSGGLNISRVGTGGIDAPRIVVLGAENSYAGATNLTGLAGQNILLVRLDHAESIPEGSGLTLTNSVILGLSGADFTRTIQTDLANPPGAGQFKIAASNNHRVGWAAFGEDRAVNIGGDGRQVIWGGSGLNLASNNFLALGHPLADKTIDFQNQLTLTTGASVTNRSIHVFRGSAAVAAVISGVIDDGAESTSNLEFTGDGTLRLTNANTYKGTTSINGSGGLTLLVDHPQGLPSGALSISGTGQNGAQLGLGEGNDAFVRELGPAENQVRLSGNSGFAAYGGNRGVNLGGTPAAPIVWGSPDFLATGGNQVLILSHEAADGILDFQSPIDLGGQTRSVRARNGSAAVDGKLSGAISGTGGLTKLGPGTLELSAANSYTGNTSIDGGTLLLTNASAIPGGITAATPTDGSVGDIVITTAATAGAGGIGTIGLGHGDFTRALGTGGGRLDTPNSLGFAAHGADRVVNLGGASLPLVWGGTASFISGNFALGATNADAMVDFQNPIDLNGAERILHARLGSAPIDGRLSGVISGTGASTLRKESGGTLELTAANTYEGGTILNGGRLLVNNATGSGTGSGDVTVNGAGAVLGGTGHIGGNVLLNAGNVAPGNAAEFLTPGMLTVGGNVNFVTSATALNVELANGAHDKLTVGGAAILNGSLNVSLLAGFTPSAGTTFEILSAAGGVSGTFANVSLPSPTWQITYNPGSVVLTAGAAGLAGDFNGDGAVNAADYVWWRKFDGSQDGYNMWRSNFGAMAGGGAAAAGAQAVPEPATLALLAFVGLYCAARRTRGVRVCPTVS